MIFGMTTLQRKTRATLTVSVMLLIGLAQATSVPDPWVNDLTPLSSRDWNELKAKHLLERAGFGATPEEIQLLARLTPSQAVKHMVRYASSPEKSKAFEDSGAHDAGLEPFAASRPAATDLNADGNVHHTTDFRRVYATLMSSWMGADSQALLNGKFETLPVFVS